MFNNFFFEKRAFYEIKWNYTVESGKTQMKMVHVHCMMDT